jgi:phosphoenolpyruvate phosphomutase
MRSSVKVMEDIAKEIATNETLMMVEDKIASVSEIFRLQGARELQEAEKIYLPTKGKEYTSIILAASRGKELLEITKDKPKAMIAINKSPVLYSSIDILNSMAIKEIYVVRGYKKETISGPNFQTIDNIDYENTRDLYSLYVAKDFLKKNCIISYGDCLYKKHLIQDILDGKGDIRIVVDADKTKKAGPQDMVKCTRSYTFDFFSKEIYLEDVLEQENWENANGEWTGLMVVESKGIPLLVETLEELSKKSDFKQMSMTHLLEALLKKTQIVVVYTKGGWIDIDDLADYHDAGMF